MPSRSSGSYSSSGFSLQLERATAMRLFNMRSLFLFGSDNIEQVVELFAQLLLLGCSFGNVDFEFGLFGRNAVVLVFRFEEERLVVSRRIGAA